MVASDASPNECKYVTRTPELMCRLYVLGHIRGPGSGIFAHRPTHFAPRTGGGEKRGLALWAAADPPGPRKGKQGRKCDIVSSVPAKRPNTHCETAHIIKHFPRGRLGFSVPLYFSLLLFPDGGSARGADCPCCRCFRSCLTTS